MDTSESTLCQSNRTSPRERRHEAIIDAAEALFLEQGYERTSLAEIVKRSGGSLATLYELFGNKQGLLYAIASRWREQTMAEAFDRDAVPAQSNAEILIGYARSKSCAMNSPRAIALMRMMVSEGMRDPAFALQTYRDMHLPTIAEVSDLFAEWTATGQADIDDPEAAARMFFSLISGDTVLSALGGIEEGMLDEAQIAWRLKPFFAYFSIR